MNTSAPDSLPKRKALTPIKMSRAQMCWHLASVSASQLLYLLSGRKTQQTQIVFAFHTSDQCRNNLEKKLNFSRALKDMLIFLFEP